MFEPQQLMRALSGQQAASTIGGVFNKPHFVLGLAAFDGGHREAPFYRLPTRDRNSPVPGLGAGCFYDVRDSGAGHRAWVDASYVDSADLRFTPQVIAPGHEGPLTSAAIHGVFGFTASSRFTPCVDHNDLQHRQDFSPLAAEWRRFHEASAEPTVGLLDYINHCAHWFWLLERPEHLRWSDTRKREYDEAAKQFAGMLGGYADPRPLLQTFALPGACEVKNHGCGYSTNAPVQVISPAFTKPEQLPPRYGRRFDDLMPLAERIAATPLLQA